MRTKAVRSEKKQSFRLLTWATSGEDEKRLFRVAIAILPILDASLTLATRLFTQYVAEKVTRAWIECTQKPCCRVSSTIREVKKGINPGRELKAAFTRIE